MVKRYSLLFLGHQTFKGTLLLEDSIDCWQQVTIALHNCLKELEDVDYSFRDNHAAHPGFYSQLPKVDAVLFWGVPQIWIHYDHRRMKRATGCKAVITVCERALAEHSNWRFAFCGGGPLTTVVDAPVWKSVYTQRAKRAKTVLIDHWDQNTPCDWTHQIEAWLKEVAHEFEISRYVQNETNERAPGHEKTEPNVNEIRRMPFRQWLEVTDCLETFVMTHRESYGYAVLDMFARGTRVVCPRPFLPPHFRDKFEFETFNTKDELIVVLRTPPSAVNLMRNRTSLTDWHELVRMIDARFQNLLSRRCKSFLSPVWRRV
jgi:hypothetical protein